MKSNESSLEDLDFLRKQVIDKDNRVQELLLEKAEAEENHAKDIDEIAETSVNEISELEQKLEAEQEKLNESIAKHFEEIAGLKQAN